MKKLIESIIAKKFDEANAVIEENFNVIMRKKLVEMKKMIGAKSVEEQRLPMNKRYPNAASKVRAGINEDELEESDLPITTQKQKTDTYRHKKSGREIVATKHPGDEYEKLEEENLDEAQRIQIVRARIRGGKIQRRKKVSNVPGFTFRGGKLTRMSPSERRRRKMGQRRGKIKRKAKMNRAMMKRKRSLMKRRAIGLR